MEDGWYASIKDTPLYHNLPDVHLEEHAVAPVAVGAAEAAPAEPAGMAEGEVEQVEAGPQEARLPEARNIMELCLQIVAHRTHVALLKMIEKCSGPSKRAHGHQVVICKTQAGCEWWNSRQAAGEWVSVALEEPQRSYILGCAFSG